MRPQPVEVSKEQQALFAEYSEEHSGPLPPAWQLAQYERVMPGLADRIVSMAEREQDHRHVVEQTQVVQPFLTTRRGQICGVIVVVLTLTFAAYIAHEGNPELAAAIAALDVVGLVGVFVTGQWWSGRGGRVDGAHDDS